MKLESGEQQTTQAPTAPLRIWEVDFLRGMSIILMVLYHILYDLRELCGIKTLLGLDINVSSAFFVIAQNFFAGLFILLCGISSTLTRSNIRRSLRLLGIAVVITAATYLFNSSSAIYFGILHCLGICILIYGLTLERSKPRAYAGAGALVIGLDIALSFILRNVPVRFDWLLPLGITSDTFTSMDYFPLLPWFGVFLLGAALGKSIYLPKRSLIPKQWPESFINTAGRHSLLIYVVHQPVILAVLYISGLMRS